MANTRKQSEVFKRVLWAVDAFPDSPDIQAQAGRAIRSLLQHMPATVEPVYVVRPVPPALFAYEGPALQEGIEKHALENLEWLAKLVQLPNIASPHFLAAEKPSVGSVVSALIEYAKKGQFDLIAVGTHARKGVPRLFLGSVAERLILESPLPVLVTNASATFQVRSPLKHFLFPTDFSESSRKVFDSFLSTARLLDVDILIFHQEEYLYPQLAYPFVVPPVSQASLAEMRAAWRKQGTEWVTYAKKMGVRAKFHLARPGASTAKSIVKAAKKLPSSMIAMASQSSLMESVLLGSVTRQVVRTASCPIFVIHPEVLKRAPVKLPNRALKPLLA